MYVNQRSGFDLVSDPYAGEFGELGEVDVVGMAASLGPCVVNAKPATCAWNVIKGVVLAQPDVELILMGIVNSDCAAACSLLNLPSEVSSILCGLGGSVWAAIQQKASGELQRLTYGRGTDRPVAQGGGHTLVDASGAVIGVACPPYLVQIGTDSAGYPTYSVTAGPTVGPSEACPQSVVPEKPTPAFKLAMKKLAKTMTLKTFATGNGEDEFKTGDEDIVVAKPWYKNKWVWIGAAVVLAVGGTAVVVAGRSR